MKRVVKMGGVALSMVRRLSRRCLCLALLGFQIFGACVIAWGWIVPEVAAVRECLARREAERHRVTLERNRDDARRNVELQIKDLQNEIAVFGSLSVDDSQSHSWARELADVAGLTLTQFVAMEAAGAYLITLEGAFANAVMLAGRLGASHSAFRVRRFIARPSQTPDDYLELEILIQKSLPTAEFGPSCITR